MQTVAKQFSDDMDRVLVYMDLVEATFRLAKYDLKKLRSRHPVAAEAQTVHGKAIELGSGRVLAYDGAFLTACAQFELAVRLIIETYVRRSGEKLPDFNTLPKAVKDWYPKGCAHLLLNLHYSRLQHLKTTDILASIASCVKPPRGKSYHLIGEAFSDNDRNFRAEVLVDVINERLGIEKIWNKLSREASLVNFIGNRNPASVDQLARKKLDWAMDTRNAIVHRGRQYCTTSESEVRDAARFFSVLVVSLATVLDRDLQSL